jgi:hypothetical protein
VSIYTPRTEIPIRIRCDRCSKLSGLHLFGPKHAREQMMQQEPKFAWRCQPVRDGNGKIIDLTNIEDVCDACLVVERREQAAKELAECKEAERRAVQSKGTVEGTVEGSVIYQG